MTATEERELYNRLDSARDSLKPASERAPVEPQAHEGRCAGATSSGSVSSAGVFEELNQMATDYEDIGQERTADTIRAVAEMYRRHAACTIPRHPIPNVKDEPRSGK